MLYSCLVYNGAYNSFLRPAQYVITATTKNSSQQCRNCWPIVIPHPHLFLLETDHKLMSQWQNQYCMLKLIQCKCEQLPHPHAFMDNFTQKRLFHQNLSRNWHEQCSRTANPYVASPDALFWSTFEYLSAVEFLL